MNKCIISLLLLLHFQLNNARGQNLVPNGSFENFSQCPFTSNQIYFAIGWFQPHKYPGSVSVNQSSSSDYFNSCYPLGSGPGIPNNGVGFQYPKTGNAFIGISLYSYYSNENAYREYAEVMLNQELISGKKYNLKYFVTMANISLFSITKFDAYFSNDSLLYTSPDFYKIPVSPQIQYSGRIDDTLNWVEVSGSYTAVGGERFLTLGNFQEGYLCDSLRTNVTTFVCCSAYYYIDDVSLEEDTLTGIQEINRIDFNLYPNPATNKIRISTAQKITGVKVLNLYSKPVLLLNPSSNQTEIDLDELANGIYLVECEFTSGEKLTKKLVVRH